MSQYLDWKVGDRVVALETVRHKTVIGSLKKGKTYVIREIGLTMLGNVGIRVDGLILRSKTGFWAAPNGSLEPCNGDHFIHAKYFRKVEPHKTSIAIFEQMLHPSKKRERAPA